MRDDRPTAAITRVSFIGIGNMGAPMAAHLIERGFDVTVFDVRQEVARHFVSAHGGRVATSLAEAGQTTQAAITMLPDHSSVRQALLDADGLASALAPGAIAIDMSTSDPLATIAIGAELAQRGIGCLDAPVMGGVVFANDATLDILVGGEDAHIEQCRALFMAMGQRVFRCGPLGSAHALKLIANYVNASTLVALIEAMAVGRKFGLNTQTMTDALISMCCGRQHPLEKKVIPQVLTRKFGSGMALGLMAKDVTLAANLAHAMGAASPLADCVRQIWMDAAAKAVVWLNDGNNRSEAVRILVEASRQSSEDTEKSYDMYRKIDFFETKGEVSKKKVAEVIEILRSDMRDKPLDINRLFLPNVTRVTE